MAVGDEERVEWSREIERLRRYREERARSVPCGLRDADRCEDPGGCALVQAGDCPLRLRLEREAAARRRAEASARAVLDEATRLGIPERVWSLLGIGCQPVALVESTALLAVREMRGTFLVLVGPTGTGKTVAAAWWAWTRRGRVVKASRLARMSWYDEARVDALIGAPALVVDELGTECDDAKGVWRSRLDELCDARYDARRPTVITSNLPETSSVPGERTLSALVGARIWERWLEDGAVVRCVGENLRAVPR